MNERNDILVSHALGSNEKRQIKLYNRSHDITTEIMCEMLIKI